MEPEPQTTTFSYPEPDQSDPHTLILLFRSHFNIIIPLRLFFQVISFLPPTTFPLQSVLTLAAYRQATRNSYRE